MGRTLLIEEDLQSLFSTVLSNQKLQVGLIIGQLGEHKDFAIRFAKCPDDPGDDAAEIEVPDSAEHSVPLEDTKGNGVKKQERKKQPISNPENIDIKWVTEHARQVNRMLIGGISVVGIYVCCSVEFLNKNLSKLKACLQSVFKKIERNKWVRQSLAHCHRYLLHLCSSSKKLTVKTLDLLSEQTELKPADSRVQHFLTNWNSVSTCIDVNVQFYVPLSQETSRIENKVLHASQNELEDIWNSYAAVGSKLVDSSKLINENSKSKKAIVEDKEIQVVLFKPMAVKNKKEYCKYEHASILIKLVGSICSKAFINNKATYGDAVKAVKLDIIRSVLTRIELLCEEAEINNMCHVDEWSLMSPTRVFAPFKCDNMYFCDYIFKDESAEDTLGRFLELLSISPHKGELCYPERSPEVSEVSMILLGEKAVDHHSDVASELSTLSSPEEPRDKKIYAAVIAGVAALFATALHFIWGE